LADLPLTAIETTGTIDEHNRLHLDSLLPISGPKRVRVILLSSQEEWEEVNETEWLHAATKNPSFEFLHDPNESLLAQEFAAWETASDEDWLNFEDSLTTEGQMAMRRLCYTAKQKESLCQLKL